MYCKNLDSLLDELLVAGAVKLPTVKNAVWRIETYDSCLKEIGRKSYGENLNANIKFLEGTGILSDLLPKLAYIAKKKFGIMVSDNDVYNVCRLVRPGDVSEGYRGHFDSHLFTLVTPINIPDFKNVRNCGQLLYFPKARRQPKNEFDNIIGKVLYKRHNTEKGFDELGVNKTKIIDDFKDYRPLLFLGNTTFHGNAPVQGNSNENRMTILTHFFDPSPKYGIGSILRRLRRR
ncbi:hypothetical protein N9X34_04170 [Alphaproteobacteria bacterium]|nr:hypothetical protein [Alphaproteobacteria bacterium]